MFFSNPFGNDKYNSMHQALSKVLSDAFDCAKQNQNDCIMAEHLLLSLLNNKDARKMLTKNKVNISVLEDDLHNFLNKFKISDEKYFGTTLTNELMKVFEVSLQKAEENNFNPFDNNLEIYFLGILDSKDCYANYFLRKQKLSEKKVIDYLKKKTQNITEDEEDYVANKDIIGIACVELVEIAKENKIDQIVGREPEVERLIKTLNRRKKANVVLVGGQGVGKTAVVEGLAVKIAKNEVPDCLKNFRIYSLNISDMVAGTKFRGDFEERVKSIVEEIKKDKHCILFIDEIHTILGSGSGNGNSLDGANILKPALSRGEIRCVGATTYDEYKNVMLKDKAFSRRFQKIDVNEPNFDETFQILNGSKHYYEDYHHVKISDEVIKHAIELSNFYINDRFQPDKSLDVIDEAGSAYRAGYKKGKEITKEDVEEVICKWTNRTSVSLKNNEKENLRTLEIDLKNNVFGQDEIIEKIVKIIKAKKAGIILNNKPISLLFSGETGCGKTELSRQIANILNMNFLKFDMSEYSTEIDVTKLNGVAPGYVGFDQPGALTEEIIKHPNSVVLLDEIEKAHPKIYNMFLQVMDDGVMTDNNNRKADFKNVILIMTSNVGCGEANAKSSTLGFSNNKKEIEDKSKTFIENALKKQFTPEFRNRLTSSFIFNSLSKESMKMIVEKFLKQLNKNLIEKGVVVSINDDVKSYIVDKAKELNLGGRPIEKILTEEVSEKIIDDILFGKLSNGGFVNGEMKNNKIELTISQN